jgi:hypothetical protein
VLSVPFNDAISNLASREGGQGRERGNKYIEKRGRIKEKKE